MSDRRYDAQEHGSMTAWQKGRQARAARLESGAKLAKVGEILVKTLSGVALLDRSQFLGGEIRS